MDVQGDRQQLKFSLLPKNILILAGHQKLIHESYHIQVFGLLNDIFYGLGAYLIYVEWKANPTGAPAPPPA